MKQELTPLETFLVSDYEVRGELLNDAPTRAAVEAWAGPAAFKELLALASDSAHLSGGPKNIVFAPGIMGSTLQSNGLGGVWWMDMIRGRGKLDKLRLNDAGDGDADEEADIVPGAIDISYEPFCRAVAQSNIFGGTSNFPYDWRKSLGASVGKMRELILRTYEGYEKKVHLVGHSMGGLMIRATLMAHGEELWPKVDKIVFIGTPHYGSPAIAGYLKKHLWGWEELAVVGMFLSRETFRSLRGALSLLPAPSGIYPGTRGGEPHPCANFDLYQATEWKLGLTSPETIRLQSVLDEVKRDHQALYDWHKSLAQEQKDRMLMIAGVGQDGVFRLELDKVFGLWDRSRRLTRGNDCDVNLDGDGSVPLASAMLEGVTTRYAVGAHGGLPNIPAVARDVILWLTGRNPLLPKTCKGALTDHLAAETQDTKAPVLDGTAVFNRLRVLPEYEDPKPEFREQIIRKLDAGQLPNTNRVKIL